ncbi:MULTISPECIES: ABC transporter substrate-binding protein [Bacillus]|uniref:Sugar ABC transporter substrate-binding protein n=2 Tax=Bacillus TaxID=1386 RepID=A0A0M4FQM0_9BACI|nr:MULTISPECIES: sugar ABC transporter substrate-binding protein [Bacillus]ALC81510.1 sugar ABC transporter substrate-binding protein [Bacillus gobiensis]MBP1080558.1 ABC-type glycerol-3-phosphate transport system substrate-binding protein [Bacillus capparidis]MED1094414.1 sugar ABC transporter substrate-binding protein [Bacillus capparidis]
MKKKWWSIPLVCLMVFALFLSGCNSDEGSTKETPEGDGLKGTLKVQILGDIKLDDATNPTTGKRSKGLHVIRDEFQKQHPEAKIEFINVPWDNYVPKTQAMISSGEADVYQMPGITDFASQGLLEPLEPFIEKDKFDLGVYIDNQMDGWKTMGPDDEELKTYGLPVFGDTRFIYFDKKLFDDWGVEYLSENPTLEEIAEKAKKMTGKNPKTGEENYGVYFMGNHSTLFTLLNAVEGQNATWGSGFKFKDMKFQFNSPEMEKGLNWLLDLKQYAPKGLVSAQGSEKWLTKDNNIAIMLNQGPDGKLDFAEKLDGRLGIVDEFKNSEGVGGMFAGSPFAIAKNSKNKELAWEFLKFTSSDFYQKFMWEEHGVLPVVKSSLEWDSVKNSPLTTAAIKTLATPIAPRYPWASSQPRFILQSKIEGALTGELTAKEALEQAQTESEDWLETKK